MVLWWACGLFATIIDMTCHVNSDHDVISLESIEALEFSCIENTRTKSIQKEINNNYSPKWRWLVVDILPRPRSREVYITISHRHWRE